MYTNNGAGMPTREPTLMPTTKSAEDSEVISRNVWRPNILTTWILFFAMKARKSVGCASVELSMTTRN